MSPQDGFIIAFAVLDVLGLVALAVVGLRFKALANRGQQMARPLIDRGTRIAGTGRQMVGTGRTRSQAMLHVLQALSAHVSARIETTRRILTEVAHPDTSSLQTVTRTIEQGRAWSERLGRLRAAAQRASASNGHGRRPV